MIDRTSWLAKTPDIPAQLYRRALLQNPSAQFWPVKGGFVGIDPVTGFADFFGRFDPELLPFIQGELEVENLFLTEAVDLSATSGWSLSPVEIYLPKDLTLSPNPNVKIIKETSQLQHLDPELIDELSEIISRTPLFGYFHQGSAVSFSSPIS